VASEPVVVSHFEPLHFGQTEIWDGHQRPPLLRLRRRCGRLQWRLSGVGQDQRFRHERPLGPPTWVAGQGWVQTLETDAWSFASEATGHSVSTASSDRSTIQTGRSIEADQTRSRGWANARDELVFPTHCW